MLPQQARERARNKKYTDWEEKRCFLVYDFDRLKTIVEGCKWNQPCNDALVKHLDALIVRYKILEKSAKQLLI
jgi:hypothetical protein